MASREAGRHPTWPAAAQIAWKRFNTTVTALTAVNALANPDALAEGEALLVPVGFRIR